MAHLVCRRGKYWSLEISVRVGKKVRKQRLAYYGTQKPSDPHARMAQMLDTAERKAEAVDAMQKATFGETASERRAREDEEAKFSQQKFMEETTSPALPTSADTADNSPEENDQSAYTSEASDHDAEPSSEGEGS